MPDIPKHVVKTISRHEWVIGDEHKPDQDAKNFEYGLLFAKRAMTELGVDLNYDNAYSVRAGEGASIVVFVDIETVEDSGEIESIKVKPGTPVGFASGGAVKPVTFSPRLGG